MPDLFHDSTKRVPKGDEQIIRVDMETLEIGGRKSHLPAQHTEKTLSISHVPNAGSKS